MTVERENRDLSRLSNVSKCDRFHGDELCRALAEPFDEQSQGVPLLIEQLPPGWGWSKSNVAG